MPRFSRMAVALTTTLALGANQVAFAQAQAAPVQFNVAAITDFHGHFEQTKKASGEVSDPGAAVLSCMVPKLADGHAQAFVSSGDNIGGSSFSSAMLQDTPTLEILNAMGLEASAVGNHEFDKGFKDLTGRVGINGDGQAHFPYLAANITGDNPDLKPYWIKEMNGVKVAFVGTVTDTTPQIVAADAVTGLEFANPLEVTNRTATELKKSGQADVVVALIHEGNYTASQFGADVDAALGGHTHVTGTEKITRADGSPFVWAQANAFGKAIADLDFTFDSANKKVSDIQVRVVDAAGMMAECGATPDQEVQAIVDKAVAAASAEGNRPVTNLKTDILKAWNESQLANLIAEAAKEGIATKTSVKPDLGLINPGGVRADLNAGEVTYKEVFDVQPFANDMTYATLTGAEIKAVLEQQWQTKNGNETTTLLGWSNNFSYTFDLTRPKGDRITSISVDGAPIDPAKSYVVAAGAFLLNGGDGFTALKNGTMKSTGILDVDLFTDYLATHPDLTPRTSQVATGVSFANKPEAGKDLTINLDSLSYEFGETAAHVTVSLGTAKATAPIDLKGGDTAKGTLGTAKVTLPVPDGVTGIQQLTVTTDSGTKAVIPVDFGETKPTVSGSSGAGVLVGLGLLFAAFFGAGELLKTGQFAEFKAMIDQAVRDMTARLQRAQRAFGLG
ncbi:bifunctional UDP-sugar hydrolase/5'-nucleotidase [Staphylococcus chromogenes]|nr:bifunctional UDP-sugar hydrolase/5'-nucleotidase [Staphylococcus chromogenes]